MAKIDVAATIQETSDLLEQKDELLSQISDNRFLLRAAVRAKQTSAEQTRWIQETFPEQQTKTPEERVAAREAALKDAQDKAAKAAANSKGTRSRAAA